MRAELRRLLDTTDLWDGRVGVLQVTDASNGAVRIRALASAADAPSLFDLRCYVREGLVRWLQREMPSALPRTRWEGAVAGGVPAAASVPDERPADAPVIEVPGAEVAMSPLPVPVPVPVDAAADGAGSVAGPGPEQAPEPLQPALASTDDEPSRGPVTILLTTAAPSEPAPRTAVPPEPAASAPIGSAPTMVVPMSDGEPATVSRRSVRRSGESEESRPSGQQETVRLDLSASDSRLFTGSIDAIERSKAFTGPGEGAYAERDEAVAKAARAERAEQEAAERHGAANAEGAVKTEGKVPTAGGPDR